MHSPPSSGITGAAVSNAMHGLPSAHAASTTSHRAPSPLSQPPAGGLPLTPRGGDFGLAKEMQQAAKASAPAPVAPAVAKPRPLALAKPVLLQSPASKAAAILAAAPQPVTAGAKSGALPAAATGGSSFAFKAAIGNNKALPSSYGAMEDVDSDGDEAPILSRQAVKSAAAAAGPSSSAAPPKILTTTSSSSAVRTATAGSTATKPAAKPAAAVATTRSTNSISAVQKPGASKAVSDDVGEVDYEDIDEDMSF
ncbi:MAG: hypothetical protein WDW38_003025 [Sanguina aurantia]